MLRVSVRALRLAAAAAPKRSGALSVRASAGSQRRSMGFFSDLKNQLKSEMDKNEELKKSFEELGRAKESVEKEIGKAKESVEKAKESVEKATKGKIHDVEEAAKHASQKLKDSYQEGVKARAEEEEEKKSAKAEAAAEASDKTGENPEDGANAGAEEQQKKTEDENLEGARSFVKNVFAKISAQKTKIVSANHQWNDEWKEAARELFGSKEKRTVDEALTAVRTPSMKPTTAPAEGEEPTEYTGTSALVAVKEEESAWQKVSARFREAPIIQGILDAAKQAARTEAGKKVGAKAKQARDKIGDAKEEVLEIWETSQNPWVYRLSSIYDGLFGETPMAIAIKEIRRAEPDFILEEWKENIEEIVLPGVLEAFLRGNSRDLKKWFGEAAYSRINIAIRERKTEGLVMDDNILSIDNVEVIEATAEDKQAPIILVRFSAQQINCIRNREGEVVEGSEDEVLAYYYIFAFQRDYDDEMEALRWRIVDIHMQRGGRYY